MLASGANWVRLQSHRSDTTSHDDPTSYTPPESFGPFRVLHQIGAGVLGPVFRTYDAENDRLVAVKALKLDLTPESQRRLVEELDAIVELELDHPSLVNIVAAGIEGTTAYVAEEYVGAESLDIALRHYAPAPIQTILPFIKQLAGAIDFARAAGVMHGALHPRDIFLTPDQARATGFGMAHALEAVGARPTVRRPYSAPERVSGAPWGTEADVYALAAITYELLTAKRIAGAGGQSVGASPESHANVYPAILDVLETALAVEPGRRYPSALVLVAALTKAMAAAPPIAAETRDASADARASMAQLPFATTDDEAPAGAVSTAAPAADSSFLDAIGDVPARWTPAATVLAADGANVANDAALGGAPDDGEADQVDAIDEFDEMAEHDRMAAPIEAGPDSDFDAGSRELTLAADEDIEDDDDAEDAEPEPEARPTRPPVGARPRVADLQFDRVLDDMTGRTAAGVDVGGTDRDDDDLDEDVDDDAIVPSLRDDRARVAAGDDREATAAERGGGPPWPPRRWPGGPPRATASWSTAVLGSAAAVALVIGFILGSFWGAPQDVIEVASEPATSAIIAGGEVTADSQPAAAAIARSVGPDVVRTAETAGADRSSSAPVPPPEAASASARPVRQEAPTSSNAGEPAAVPQASNGPVVPASNRDGRLLIRTTPAGARVSIDGQARGTSPLVVRDLEYGAYAVQVSLAGYATQTTRLTVTRERPAASVTLDLLRPSSPVPSPAADAGALFIDSRPRGARVIVDGQVIGTTPMQMLALPAGTHDVRLELDGYRTWTSTVQVRGGETSRVTGSLDQQRF